MSNYIRALERLSVGVPDLRILVVGAICSRVGGLGGKLGLVKLPGLGIIVPASEGTAGWNGCGDSWGPAAITHEELRDRRCSVYKGGQR